MAVGGTMVGCGGSSAVPQATPSVERAHLHPYPASTVERFVRSDELKTVSMPIRLCVVGHFEDEMPYSQFESLLGTGALIDSTIRFAAECAAGR